jgi:small subunit ribosomal protein S24e
MADRDTRVTLRTRKFIRNQLLSRRQMVVYVTSIAASGHYLVIGANNKLISFVNHSDVLHPNRPNVSKDELRGKLAELYKANKDQVQVFGFRTQYGGGKSTGFALIYDSHEALKKFEPHYRLVRIGAATKIEKASRQQRTFSLSNLTGDFSKGTRTLWADQHLVYRKATQEQSKGVPGYGEDEGCVQGQEEMSRTMCVMVVGCVGRWSSLSPGMEYCASGTGGLPKRHFCAC